MSPIIVKYKLQIFREIFELINTSIEKLLRSSSNSTLQNLLTTPFSTNSIYLSVNLIYCLLRINLKIHIAIRIPNITKFITTPFGEHRDPHSIKSFIIAIVKTENNNTKYQAIAKNFS